MTYQISALDHMKFADLFGMDDAELARHGAVRVRATAKPGFPCRVSLQDAEIGEELILLHHVSHNVATPYRSSYAIYVRKDAVQAEKFVDQLPPIMQGRPIALRGFDGGGMLRGAMLAEPGQVDMKIGELFDDDNIAYIHAHNAAHGCFAAHIDRT